MKRKGNSGEEDNDSDNDYDDEEESEESGEVEEKAGKRKASVTKKKNDKNQDQGSKSSGGKTENEARKKKLESNRIASRESRKRKKKRVEELQRSVLFLTHENHQLREQNELLRQMLVGRLPSAGTPPGINSASTGAGNTTVNANPNLVSGGGSRLGTTMNSRSSSTVVTAPQDSVIPQFNTLHPNNVNNYQNNLSHQRNNNQTLGMKNVNIVRTDANVNDGNGHDTGGLTSLGQVPPGIQGLVARAESVARTTAFGNNHGDHER